MTRTLSHSVIAACRVVGQVFGTNDTVSRQCLLKSLATCVSRLLEAMVEAVPKRIKSLKGSCTQNGKGDVAVDGTKFSAPRTKANQKYFAAAGQPSKKNGQSGKAETYQLASDQSKASKVQVLVTVFFHQASGLSMRWNVSASNGSERKDALAMF